ncbi:MAG: redox-sensing transcriptional repressor Rex [Clostridia bacterium]|nr:redox-sensing transcriptional repressor Rex [Clostridia bacterium]
MSDSCIPRATLGRLPMYLTYLQGLKVSDHTTISAAAIARGLNLGEVMVRKDLAAVSGSGRPKVGYVACELICDLQACLEQRSDTKAVLIGAGKLGRALLEFSGFEEYGIQIVAAFDCNDQVLRYSRTSKEILPMREFAKYCLEQQIRIGIITVGAGSAQQVADMMVDAGIRAIWNFAPFDLHLPSDVVLKQENLALSLAHLCNQLK